MGGRDREERVQIGTESGRQGGEGEERVGKAATEAWKWKEGEEEEGGGDQRDRSDTLSHVHCVAPIPLAVGSDSPQATPQ